MELTNEFRVAVPVEQAWAVLTDVERIAPCMPGAQLQEIEGDEYRGVVKVKVGPITAQYKGAATFQEKDDGSHRAVLKAEGRETRGQGNASALITATLTPDGDGTSVSVVTDLTITGRVAQFGRGVLADVSSKLLGQFVDCLESSVLSGDDSAPAAPAPVPPEPEPAPPEPTASSVASAKPEAPVAMAAPAHDEPVEAIDLRGDEPTVTAPSTNGNATTEREGIRRIEGPEAKPVDLLDTAGAPVAKRLAPLLTALVLIFFLGRRRRRRRARR